LLDSETATEDDGLDLFDEAPRYIYANNFWVFCKFEQNVV
jgi:hypothetical protein